MILLEVSVGDCLLTGCVVHAFVHLPEPQCDYPQRLDGTLRQVSLFKSTIHTSSPHEGPLTLKIL